MSGSAARGPGGESEALLAELVRRGYAAAEVYEKRGRSRGFERSLDHEISRVATEEGWSARAGDARRSLFVAGTGRPTRSVALPDASPNALLLAEPREIPAWREPADLLAPLATENEASSLLDGIARALLAEIPGARLVAASLLDGSSEAALVSSRGVRAAMRSRIAWLRLEAESAGERLLFSAAEREARRFRPDAIARRLADRFAAVAAGARDGKVPGDAEFVLSAPLVARIVEALAPGFLGRTAETRLAPLLDGERRIAAAAVTLIDDGRFEGAARDRTGLLAAATDGEGVATGAVTLVEEGRFVQPLCAWWEESVPRGTRRSAGCSRRASWRDLPRRAPTHFYLAPGEARVRELVEGVADGAYLIEAEGAVTVDPRRWDLTVPVCGYRLVAGRAVAPLGRRILRAQVGTLLRGIRTLARDLTFVPGDGQFGAPTVVATGLVLSESGAAPSAKRDQPPATGSSTTSILPVE